MEIEEYVRPELKKVCPQCRRPFLARRSNQKYCDIKVCKSPANNKAHKKKNARHVLRQKKMKINVNGCERIYKSFKGDPAPDWLLKHEGINSKYVDGVIPDDQGRVRGYVMGPYEIRVKENSTFILTLKIKNDECINTSGT
jgi:hypothetical protein